MTDAKKRAEELGLHSIPKLLIKFSLPAIIGMLVNALYNVVDRIFIGKYVDEMAIGAIQLVSPMVFIIMAFGMLLGIGGNTLVSIRLGEEKNKEADHVAGNALVLLMLFSSAIAVLGLFLLEPFIRLLGAENQVHDYAVSYMRIIFIGAPFNMISYGMNNFIRGEGNPKMAMKTMLIGAFVNTALDYLFVAKFRWGVAGAAFATIFSQAISMTWVLAYFFRGKSLLHINLSSMKLSPRIVRSILSNGFAPFAMQLAASIVSSVMNKSLTFYGGDAAIASMGVIHSISLLILMPIFGMNQGAQPIFGYNYGAKKYDRVKKTLLYSCVGATLVTIGGFLLCQLHPEMLFRLFLAENERFQQVLSVGVPAMRTVNSVLFLIGAQIICTMYFQSTGKPKQAMFLSLARQVLFLIPLLLILPNFFQLNGVWMAIPMSDGISSITTFLMIYHDLKKLSAQTDII